MKISENFMFLYNAPGVDDVNEKTYGTSLTKKEIDLNSKCGHYLFFKKKTAYVRCISN